jgi:uncharacterized protein
MDQGLFAGVILGALVGALIGGKFRIQTFSEPGTPSIFRYAGGAALMGFGGVLAGGCTVGAGLSGGSILAVTALLALARHGTGAVTDRIVDRRLARRREEDLQGGLRPSQKTRRAEARRVLPEIPL